MHIQSSFGECFRDVWSWTSRVAGSENLRNACISLNCPHQQCSLGCIDFPVPSECGWPRRGGEVKLQDSDDQVLPPFLWTIQRGISYSALLWYSIGVSSAVDFAVTQLIGLQTKFPHLLFENLQLPVQHLKHYAQRGWSLCELGKSSWRQFWVISIRRSSAT